MPDYSKSLQQERAKNISHLRWGVFEMPLKMQNHGNSTEYDISNATTKHPVDPRNRGQKENLPLHSKQGAGRQSFLCPSAPAEKNATLLGLIHADGSVSFIKDRIEVTQEFLDIAGKNGIPETNFRFSSTCHGGACKQWAHGRCSIPERLAEMIPRSDVANAPLPNCSIRAQCRWFDQRGADACSICPLVVTRGD